LAEGGCVSLLVLGSGAPDYRRNLLRALSDLDVVLVSEAEPSWERGLVAQALHVPALIGARLGHVSPALIKRLSQVAASCGATAVVTFDEYLVECAAELAERLGLPGLRPDAARACRDKAATRQALAVAGLPQPSVAVAAPELGDIGVAYPAVVKPSTLAGSLGVRLVEDADQLVAAIDAARAVAGPAERSPRFAVLVEELITGPEISVDAAIVGGRCEIIQIARKRVTADGRFEETGHVVDHLDPLWSDQDVQQTVHRAHAALGFDHGCSHTEIKLSPRGPVVIEVNARIPGDLLPQLAQLSGGTHLARVAAGVALGARPAAARPSRAAAVRFATGAMPVERQALTDDEYLEVREIASAPDISARTGYAIAAAATWTRAEALAAVATGSEEL
jgi:biotin carboxylase